MSRKIESALYLFLLAALAIFLHGCQPKPDPSIPENPTYYQDIQPIFADRCSGCHSTLWLDYKTVVDRIDRIRYKVIETKTMPPGGISEKAFKTIKKWIDNGSPE